LTIITKNIIYILGEKMNKKQYASQEFKEKRSKLMMGKNNPRWNNGKSEYPNHALLKKNRLLILKKSKGKCEICGKKARVVHHIDGSRDNHEIDNLVAVCTSCHWALHKKELNSNKRNTSKYVRKYGMTLEEMSKKLGISIPSIRNWLKGKDKEKKTWLENQIAKI